MTLRSVLTASMILALLSTIGAAATQAATYDVVSCKEVERETIPSIDWSYAWKASDFQWKDDCRRSQ